MAFYDNFAESRPPATGIGKWASIRGKQRNIQLLRKHGAPVGGRLLEIGPGKGLFKQVCGDTFAYEAVEPNAKLASGLREMGVTVHEHKMPGLDVSEQYDVILMESVFEHFDDVHQQFQVLQECRRALVPGGLLFIHAPEYPLWKAYFFVSDYTHNTVSCAERTRQMLADTDFEIVHEEYRVFGRVHGALPARVCSLGIRFLDALGLLACFGQGRRMKIITTLLGGFVTLARKPGAD